MTRAMVALVCARSSLRTISCSSWLFLLRGRSALVEIEGASTLLLAVFSAHFLNQEEVSE